MSESEERTPVKHMDIAEFRRLGFLQEANRLFFHLHGLALEATIVDEEGWDADNPRVKDMAAGIAEAMGRIDVNGYFTASDLAVAAMNALYPVGSQHLSGVWDYRTDPEGVIFGDGYAGKTENAERVYAERRRHRAPRAELFGVHDAHESMYKCDCDVEPLGWILTARQLKEWQDRSDSK